MGPITNGQMMATALAWFAVALILVTLITVIIQSNARPDRTEALVGLAGALALAIAGAATATLPLFPTGTFDLEWFRVLFLAVPRALATVLFGALLMRRLDWRPPLIGRFLV